MGEEVISSALDMHVHTLSENEVIVLQYHEKVSLNDMKQVHTAVSNNFPNNKVISIPDFTALSQWKTKDVLKFLDDIRDRLVDSQ